MFARSGVRRFHTIEALNAIEFFIKYVLKRGTVTVFEIRTYVRKKYEREKEREREIFFPFPVPKC